MLLIKRPRQVQASSSPATPIRPSLRVASQVWRSPRDSRWFACISAKTRLLDQKGFPSSRDPPDRRLRSAYPRVSSFDCRTRAARDEAVWLWWGKKETERRLARKNVTGAFVWCRCATRLLLAFYPTALTETVQFLLDAAAAVWPSSV